MVPGYMVPDEVAGFGRALATRLAEALEGGLLGAYFVGSIALGGYVAGESDVDVIGVSERPVPPPMKLVVADAVVECAASCPARGLEFTLYCKEVAAALPTAADFELNANGGPRMARGVHLDPASEPAFWYVLDRAIAHRAGIAVLGPPPGQLFPDVPPTALLGAMRDSMRWHREHEGATLYSVLNACRAWRYAVDGVLGSKLDGATWARRRAANPQLIDSAVALRHGRTGALAAAQVDGFLRYVENTLSEVLAAQA